MHLGLRGVINLGNTCFLSVILQALIHNPLIRNYFLSDLHSLTRCARKKDAANLYSVPNPINGANANAGSNTNVGINSSTAGGGFSNSVRPSPVSSSICLACDLDEVFSSFYSGDHSVYAPTKLLLSIWTHAEHLAGYSQQDAHEFFMSLLDGLHSACSVNNSINNQQQQRQHQHSGAEDPFVNNMGEMEDSNSGSGNGSGGSGKNNFNSVSSPCGCIVHAVFGGSLRSDVTCSLCGTRSTATDPIFDISLEIHKSSSNNIHNSSANTSRSDPSFASPSQFSPIVSPVPSSTNNNPVDPLASVSLLDCLRRYTRLEPLHSGDAFICRRCGVASPCTKQLSIQESPNVLTIHLKRFQRHQNGKLSSSNNSTKIDSSVSFPLSGLDLSPYLHASLSISQSPSPVHPSVHRSNIYDCFCVIVHKGSLETGHYFCYLRCGAEWYRNDDRVVVKVTEWEVMHANAYLLFYIRQKLQN